MAGVPYGEEANDLVSTLGVLSGTTIPITYKDWRLVSLSMKEQMWEFVQVKHFFFSLYLLFLLILLHFIQWVLIEFFIAK